jgi:hypothetical protein
VIRQREGDPVIEFQCSQCGHCCLAAGDALYITEHDVKRWNKEGRKDIHAKLFLVRFHCDECDIKWPSYLGKKCERCGRIGNGVYYWVGEKMADNYLAQLLGAPRCARGGDPCVLFRTMLYVYGDLIG